MVPPELTIEAVPAISAIAADDWNGCANPSHEISRSDCSFEYNPFISHSFLSALENSGSALPRAGWAPRHLVARSGGQIVGVAPCYAKAHSRGEYVFDQGWAEAYEEAGGRYYPKLQVAVPFTPVTGPRLLVATTTNRTEIAAALAQGLTALCESLDCSSVHVTFAPESESRILAGCGFLLRCDQQFHWHNQGFASFDDFLAHLTSRHRKAIRRERREALRAGITIHWLTGADLTEEVWDAFFSFYMETGSRKWGRPYLTRAFFSLIGASMSRDVLLVMARRDQRWIAGAINFIGSNTLFGRNWGAIEHHPFLHFEICYYQAIEFAIAHGLKRIEAGAQGEHKIARGYVPETTWSAHFIRDPRLRRAIADYLRRERAAVAQFGQELAGFAPFRKAEPP
ncbi:MAG: GNAT family N-acetyltransferase [Alphaproteobacteria bacterium]|nr:GNAT family N-acetyltransferase [Alphaproteobacteria bacterium]